MLVRLLTNCRITCQRLSPRNGKRRWVPYSITVGVPVTVQPGTVTVLYPESDGSPTSAAVPLDKLYPISRRTHANNVHSTGV